MSESPKQKSTGGFILTLIIVMGLLFIGGSMLLGVLAGLIVPSVVIMEYKTDRAEVPANVDAIKVAQLAYDAAFDGYVSIPTPHPRAIDDLDREAVLWTVDAEGFETLAWGPDGPVRGTYWVEVSPDGEDFTVHGMIDADGDEVPAHYVATPNESAHALTGPNVY
ncbi:MAG: hypothetical protein AAFV53_18090 [Myxococcota bacterium]